MRLVATFHRLAVIGMVVSIACAASRSRALDQPADACGSDNLLAGKVAKAPAGIAGDPAVLTDSAVASEGAPWDAAPGVRLPADTAFLFDLGAPRSLSAFYLQGDANDTYVLSVSLEAGDAGFRRVGEFGSVLDEQGHGLRSRALEVAPITARYVRIAPTGGDGLYAISEFAVYCKRPQPFPPALRVADVAPAGPRGRPLEAHGARELSLLGGISLGLGALLVMLVITAAFHRSRRAGAPSDAIPGSGVPSALETRGERFFPWVFLLFIASGCAALVYEIVWFQLLQLVLGSSAVSIGVLLGAFMAGMCLGSLLLARYVSAARHPLRVYAVLEVAIGACGLLMLVAMPLLQRVYTHSALTGFWSLLVRGVLAAVVLLPPTVMMGATLPAVSRWVRTTPRGVSWLGYFYGANTLGAVIGCLLAGFYLLRVHDMPTATYVAVVLNLLVAGLALVLARFEPEVRTELARPSAAPVGTTQPRGRAWAVYLSIGLSGFTALAAEVIWTRQLSLLLSGSTYTFSIILAVVLAGIGVGSGIGSTLTRLIRSPARALGAVQLLLIAAIVWCAWNVTRSLPWWPINPMAAQSPWYQFQVDMVRCVWAILPAACLWGASFPLALATVATQEQDPGAMVGRVYAANTVGAIAGSIFTSIVLIPTIGTQQGQRVLIALCALSGLTMLLAYPRRQRARRSRLKLALVVVAALELVMVGMTLIAPIPPLLVGFGRLTAFANDTTQSFLYVGEGMNSSLAVSRTAFGVMSYHNAGKVQASSLPQDMRLQRMLGHLTTLLIEQPRSVLVIACGAGVTAGAASIDPRVEKLTIAEIEPLVPEVVAKYFGDHNYNVVRNPKVRVEVDDARHFLNTTQEKFDAITSDPFDPWVKGAATLYSREFWELAKSHLKPGGVVTVFVQLYDSGMEAVKSEMGTFFEVFPNGVVWGNTVNGQGYDVVLSGRLEDAAAPIDVDAMEARLSSPEYAQVAKSLREIGFNSALSLLSTYGGRGPELKPWLADAQINRDNNLRLQFLAGFGMNHDQRAEIYRGVLTYRQFPDDLFKGAPEHIQQLRTMTLERKY